ncbi:MAG: hypothetical protein V1645_01505 [archaeon]
MKRKASRFPPDFWFLTSIVGVGVFTVILLWVLLRSLVSVRGF